MKLLDGDDQCGVVVFVMRFYVLWRQLFPFKFFVVTKNDAVCFRFVLSTGCFVFARLLKAEANLVAEMG